MVCVYKVFQCNLQSWWKLSVSQGVVSNVPTTEPDHCKKVTSFAGIYLWDGYGSDYVH
jgi:hypothetical protein